MNHIWKISHEFKVLGSMPHEIEREYECETCGVAVVVEGYVSGDYLDTKVLSCRTIVIQKVMKE